MKRIFLVLLCISLVALCAGCGQSSSELQRASSDAASSSDEDTVPDASLFDAQSEDASSSAVASLNPASDATVVESQDCFYNAFCFRPEEDGTYHFCAQTADNFEGTSLGYSADTITWTVYVFDEPFDDAWRLLGQAAHPAISDLNGSTDLALEAGQYVYCVCSLNAFTSDPAPDDAGALSITITDDDYTPDASNNYQLAITLNSECRIDLDGNGTLDVIYYSVTSDTADSNGVYVGAKPSSLSINGTEFLNPEQDNPTAAYGLWLENPDVEYYYIVDLDANDSYRELAIADQGSNGNLVTYYFRYADAQLTYLGQISGFPDDHSTTFYGDGTVSAMTILNVMQTWSGLRTYTLSDGQIQMSDSEFCAPQLPDGWNVTLLQPLTVYASPNQSAEQLVLNPSSFSLSFPLTDGQHWVEVLCADGSSGWVYFTDFSTVESGGQTYNASDIFGNLRLTS